MVWFLVDLWYPCLSSRVDLVHMLDNETAGRSWSWRQEEEDEAEVEDEGM